MEVLITGGAGFLGRHFVKKFLSLGHAVTCVDSLLPGGGGSPPEKEVLLNSKFRFLNQDCVQFFKDEKRSFDIVIHLAGIVGGRQMIENQQIALLRNLVTDTELIQWAYETKPKHLILFSSSAVYPTKYQQKDSFKKLVERDADISSLNGNPDMSYGWCKQNLEYMGQVYHATTGLPCSIYRPFSGYGEDQSESYPIPNLCRLALSLPEGGILPIWGSGQQARDFIYVSDIIDIVTSTYKLLVDAKPLNICSGELISFEKIASIITKKVNKSLVIQPQASMPTGVINRFGDNSKLESFYKKPLINIEDGIQIVLQKISSTKGIK